MHQKGSLYISSSSVIVFFPNLILGKKNKYKMDLTSRTQKEQINYRLMEIGKIKDYFNEEIQYQQSLTTNSVNI